MKKSRTSKNSFKTNYSDPSKKRQNSSLDIAKVSDSSRADSRNSKPETANVGGSVRTLLGTQVMANNFNYRDPKNKLFSPVLNNMVRGGGSPVASSKKLRLKKGSARKYESP